MGEGSEMQRRDIVPEGRVEEALLYLQEAEAIKECERCLDGWLDCMDSGAVEEAVEQMSERGF